MDWQPIETAPRDGDAVLLLFQGEGFNPIVDKAYWDDVHMPSGDGKVIPKEPRNEWIVDGSCGCVMIRPQSGYTHWMPLPPPPPQACEAGGSPITKKGPAS